MMHEQRKRLRGGLVLTAAGLAAATIGCANNANPSRPSSASDTGAVVAGAGPEATSGVGPELADVRRATAGFHDLSRAIAAGYTTQFEPCVANPGVGAMGIHARNEPLMGDQIIDPLRPELLLYDPRPNGELQLAGVEYFKVVLVRDPSSTDPPRPWLDQSQPWPSNWEVVSPTPQLFGQTFDGPMPGHIPSMPWHWDLHVWVWKHNPAGMFSEWNPAVTCG